jgi:hypothetical protein
MRRIGLLVFLFLFCSAAFAQKNEVAVVGGGYFPVGIDGVGSGGAVEGNFAHRVFNAEVAAAYVEVPVVFGFNVNQVSLLGQGQYSSFFLTPSLKLKVVPGFFISPWLSLGAGLARYNATQFLAGTQSVSNHAVLQVGGGLDVKVFPYLSLRGEVRDFYSGIPALSFVPTVARQHNILAGAGIVLRF